ncbi:MAG: preprotein translocase subunit SecY [Oscillospiraceae bacterium]|jgi:preprotein translocase subunit SecY|nr:preprotein translocase subunit SecY [Oscillospiraceae bacterium]
MIETLRNAWRITDLRKKILFTLFILAIYRFGSQVFVPFVNTEAFTEMFNQQLSGTALGVINMMSGGAFSSGSIFSLSIQPYINASIIMNLLTVGIPALERMQKEGGEEGRKKNAAITRYATVALGGLLGWGNYVLMRSYNVVTEDSIFAAVIIILTLTAGSAFIMWLGEQITEFGVGNGISIILFASIVSRGPAMVESGIALVQGQGTNGWLMLFVILILAVAAVAFVVYITNAERRIPIQYSKRMVGRKMYGGQSTFLPMKVNMSGVMPIIFASSIASFPSTIAAFISENARDSVNSWFGPQSWPYAVLYLVLIVAFSYFYQAIQFNPVEIANNLKQNGGFIPGFRPGKPTVDFIRKVLNRITLFGALFLGVIAVLPIIMSNVLTVQGLAMGGTSLLIVVGVALETVKAIESQMLMRHYKGFLE